MSIEARELRYWLSEVDDDEKVYIDDGGLTLRVVEDEETYVEVGGHTKEEE